MLVNWRGASCGRWTRHTETLQRMPTFGTLNGGHTAIASSPACAVAEISKQKANSLLRE